MNPGRELDALVAGVGVLRVGWVNLAEQAPSESDPGCR